MKFSTFLVNDNWLWRISGGFWANQKGRNILNKRLVGANAAKVIFVYWIPVIARSTHTWTWHVSPPNIRSLTAVIAKLLICFFISAFSSLCMKDFHRTALLESKFHFEIKRLIFFNGRLIRSNEFDFWHTINQRQSLHMHVCIYYKEHTCNDKFLMCLVLVSKKINKSKNRETETHL